MSVLETTGGRCNWCGQSTCAEAINAELLVALRDVMNLIDVGVLVRDTKNNTSITVGYDVQESKRRDGQGYGSRAVTDVYLRAARMIMMTGATIEGMKFGCCAALVSVCANRSEEAEFSLFFRPDSTIAGYWWSYLDYSDQQARVLALLFMHWMTQDES